MERDQLLQHYRDSRRTMLAVIDGLNEAAMTDASIDGWSVKDHLLHLALWDEIRAAEVERISAGHASAWRMTGAQDEAFNAIAYEVRRDLPLAQALWEFGASRRRLLDAIARATPRGLDPLLYGEAGLISGHELEHAGWIRRWRTERRL